MATTDDEIKVDITLGHVARHCILHALTVIEAAIAQVGSSILDDFIKDLTGVVNPSSPEDKKKKIKEFVRLPPPPIVASFDINKFYENALSAVEFTQILDSQLKTASLEASAELDVEKIQQICWKYYSMEKKKAVTHADWLSPTCTYRLFLIFNQLLDDELTTVISGNKLGFFLEKIATSCGFLGPVVSQVVKKERPFGVSFPEYLEEVTNCFDYLKLETCLTCEMILDFVDELVNGVIKKGYLVKQGHVRHNWKKRYFILKENVMSYYKSRESMELKGAMVLNKATKVFPMPDERGKPLYRFVVTCGLKGKVFVMSASDQRSKSEWLCAVKEAIAIGRLKSKEQDGDADVSEVCEMSAHYKVKYGLEGLEQSISRATKRFSKNLDYNHPLACSLPNLISDSNGLTGSYGEEDDEMSYMVMHPLSPTASESVVRQSSLRSSSSARGRGDSQVSGNSSVGSQDQTSVSSRDETTGHSNPVTSSQAVYDEADHSENSDDEYYVFTPTKPDQSKTDSDDDDDDDDDERDEYLRLIVDKKEITAFMQDQNSVEQ